MSKIQEAKSKIQRDKKRLRSLVEEVYPIGSTVKARWMQEAIPLCEVVNITRDGDGLLLRLLEPVYHRIAKNGVFHPAGFEMWINLENLVDD